MPGCAQGYSQILWINSRWQGRGHCVTLAAPRHQHVCAWGRQAATSHPPARGALVRATAPTLPGPACPPRGSRRSRSSGRVCRRKWRGSGCGSPKKSSSAPASGLKRPSGKPGGRASRPQPLARRGKRPARHIVRMLFPSLRPGVHGARNPSRAPLAGSSEKAPAAGHQPGNPRALENRRGLRTVVLL